MCILNGAQLSQSKIKMGTWLYRRHGGSWCMVVSMLSGDGRPIKTVFINVYG
jgi:hypothetical protein